MFAGKQSEQECYVALHPSRTLMECGASSPVESRRTCAFAESLEIHQVHIGVRLGSILQEQHVQQVKRV